MIASRLAYILCVDFFLTYFSVYVASGLGAIFSRCNLPALNLPFVLTTFLFLASVNATRGPNDHFPTKVGASLGVNETFANSDIKWDKVRIRCVC